MRKAQHGWDTRWRMPRYFFSSSGVRYAMCSMMLRHAQQWRSHKIHSRVDADINIKVTHRLRCSYPHSLKSVSSCQSYGKTALVSAHVHQSTSNFVKVSGDGPRVLRRKTEHEAQQIRLVGALFRIRIDQGHPIRPIHDSSRFITDQIGRSAKTGRPHFQPREPDVKIS